MSIENITSKCVEELLTHSGGESSFFVAVTGDSGSGKSFYSSLIRKLLDEKGVLYTYLNADDFLISRTDREPMKSQFYESGEFKGKSKWEILENMFRLEEFSRVIDELRTTGESSYYPYSRESGKVSDVQITLKAEKLIIFDTSMLLEKMDFVIMVEVDMDKIIERKKRRDVDIRTPQEIEEMHRKVQGFYWQRKKPVNPNIVIDNNDFENPSILLQR